MWLRRFKSSLKYAESKKIRSVWSREVQYGQLLVQKRVLATFEPAKTEMKKKVMELRQRECVKTEKCKRNKESFVLFMQLLFHKKVIEVMSTVLVAYHGFLILLNLPVTWRKQLVDNGQKLEELRRLVCRDEELKEETSREDEEMSLYGLTFTMMMPLKSVLRFTADWVTCEWRIAALTDLYKYLCSLCNMFDW